jgi:hypothetical protein
MISLVPLLRARWISLVVAVVVCVCVDNCGTSIAVPPITNFLKKECYETPTISKRVGAEKWRDDMMQTISNKPSQH